ncbi:hypothetical protein WH96_06260 [Kiloniella spongiae]|uniref:HTH cro/C1-type domain-containing protein n=1 Tax=Kiloniella spongiae TaxID=1489064 RepID=A0A0H2MYR6_9PROT|nr:helix-turn-helix transcriptional regulator [Kiloniella spongiae]KLN61875.1 hypothetical protein WH96_06260 [Kiloniella spongiae]
MNSYKYKIDPRDGAYIKSLNKVHFEWANIIEDFKSQGVTISDLAKKLGVNKSVLSRRFKGESNVTLKSLSDIAWLSGKDLEIKYTDRSSQSNRVGTKYINEQNTKSNSVELDNRDVRFAKSNQSNYSTVSFD